MGIVLLGIAMPAKLGTEVKYIVIVICNNHQHAHMYHFIFVDNRIENYLGYYNCVPTIVQPIILVDYFHLNYGLHIFLYVYIWLYYVCMHHVCSAAYISLSTGWPRSASHSLSL